MRVTIILQRGDEQLFEDIDVEPSMAMHDLKDILQGLFSVEAAKQVLLHNEQPMSNLQGLREGDMILVKVRRDPTQQSRQPQQQQQQSGTQGGPQEAEILRQRCLVDPRLMQQIQQSYPDLADATNDASSFALKYEEVARLAQEAEREKARVLAQLEADPFDVESQKKIEEMIRLEHVGKNMQIALEEIPESFARTTMLYVPVRIDGIPIKAFVDSGAQATIMSASCAERTGLTRLIDKSYAGTAKGVGTAPILGRVHMAPLGIAGVALHCSFTVMAGKDVDLLLGLDMLKRHQACINLRRNVLEISDLVVAFLPESEIPKQDLQLGEPVIEGPGGTWIGGRSGAIVPAEESGGGTSGASSAVTASSSAGPSSSGLANHPLPHTPGSAPQRTAPPGGTPQPARQAAVAPPPQAGARYPQEAVAAVMNIAGVSEAEAVQALSAAGGDVNAAAGMFFGD